MKLHLPKHLFHTTAVGIVCCISFAEVAKGDLICDVGYGTSGEAATKEYEGTLEIGKDQQVGAANDSGFITQYKYDKTLFSNILDVDGDVVISENGQLFLGGQYDSHYSGILADTVTIDKTATGTVESLNLYTDRADIGTLNMHGGAAKLHTQIYNGNSFPGGDPTSYKQACIDNINITDGILYIGSENPKAHNNSHRNFYLGSGSGKISQDGGTLLINGYGFVHNGLTIEQTQGKMTIVDKITLTGSLFGTNTLTIKQTQENEAKTLSIGDIDKQSKYLKAAVNVTQSGKGGSITIKDTQEVAVYTIDQSEGTGTITIDSGAAINASSLKLSTGALLDIDGNLVLNSGGVLEINASSASDAAVSLGSTGSLSLTDAKQALTLTLSDVVASDMQTELLAADAGTFTYTIDLISADAATQLETLSQTLAWQYEGPSELALALEEAKNQITLENSGLQVVSQAANGTYMLQAYVSWNVQGNIPEPTTATLSLLALTALAARRRRK